MVPSPTWSRKIIFSLILLKRLTRLRILILWYL
nr:MAG TPA: hypothetical protein [Caudoviricetes sp.]